MDYPGDKGVTNRKHLNQIWEQTGSKPEKYKDINIPPAGEDLWMYFWDLRNTVEEKISWTDIYHYCLLHQMKFAAEELKIIQSMNSAANKWIHKKHRETLNKKKAKKPAIKKRR